VSEVAGEVRIARGGAEDLPEVKGLAGEVAGAPHWPESAWEGLVSGGDAEPESLLLLARGETGSLCGWLAASLMAEQSELEFVVVAPQQRGKGVARALMQAWVEWARDAGVNELLLEVRASNEAALRLYRGLGFQEQGRRPGYYRDPMEPAVLMGRSLLR
jgi:[ribosomal protein S18]-alanine N-acetyltransferase